MKLGDMADLFDGLATTLEKVMTKGALNDLRVVGECFRKFPEDSVTTFCTFVIGAKEGRASTKRGGVSGDPAKVTEYVEKIRHYLSHQDAYDFGTLRQWVTEIGKLTVPSIKAIGKEIGCPLTQKKKDEMLSRLKDWLMGIKSSAEQSSFTLSPASVS